MREKIVQVYGRKGHGLTATLTYGGRAVRFCGTYDSCMMHGDEVVYLSEFLAELGASPEVLREIADEVEEGDD